MRLFQRLLTNRRLTVTAGIILSVFIGLAGTVYWRANRALHGAEQSVQSERDLKFIERPFPPISDTGFDWVSAPAVFTQAAVFQGYLFVAGPAGLTEYDDRGHAVRDFRVGRELPASPLLKIAIATLANSHQPELVIATADAGILFYNGSGFRQMLPESREARTITSILPVASGRVLIGTQKRGLLVYDGRSLQPFHPTLTQVFVTELAGSETDLWIGSNDRGVSHWHGGSTEWFNESSGLPDARVYSIAVDEARTFVGTASGIAQFDDGRFVRVIAPGAFVRAVLPRSNTLIAGTMDDGLLEISLKPTGRNAQSVRGVTDLADVEQLFPSGDSLYAVTTHGIYARAAVGGWKRVLQANAGLLMDRNISALAMDGTGRLWVGYFDHGLDIVDANGLRARHLEDDYVFCINRILPNVKHGATAVATANGLVIFDRRGIRQQVLGKNEGLIAEHVTDVTPYGDGLAVATPAGLTFLDSGGVRSLYAFHGLVNNHVYAVAANGNHLLAGTLGGASLLERDQVRASYTTATSSLKHNWITAAVPVDNEWWLGTYGAGVVRMDATGRFESSNGAGGDVVINPNAMLATDRLVLAGSMGHGLYVMNRNTGRWVAVTEGLPSLNVTALTAANGFVYVGTDNGLVRVPEQRLGQ